MKTKNVPNVIKCKITKKKISHKHGVPKLGEGVPQLGKNSHIFPFFGRHPLDCRQIKIWIFEFQLWRRCCCFSRLPPTVQSKCQLLNFQFWKYRGYHLLRIMNMPLNSCTAYFFISARFSTLLNDPMFYNLLHCVFVITGLSRSPTPLSPGNCQVNQFLGLADANLGDGIWSK